MPHITKNTLNFIPIGSIYINTELAKKGAFLKSLLKIFYEAVTKIVMNNKKCLIATSKKF